MCNKYCGQENIKLLLSVLLANCYIRFIMYKERLRRARVANALANYRSEEGQDVVKTCHECNLVIGRTDDSVIKGQCKGFVVTTSNKSPVGVIWDSECPLASRDYDKTE